MNASEPSRLEPVDTETETALAVRPTQPEMPLAPAQAPPLTPQQARVEAVSHLLGAAYARASTLDLTPEQCAALKADFPDEAFKLGAGGNPELLYIEHAFLRDRFDAVIGMGRWALVRSRPHWAEEFRTQKGLNAVRLYADCALLIQGCLVSEAIGEMVYYPNNPTQSYGDAAEGSETAAFRRCAKKIGVGLQAWKKDFCEVWKERYRGGVRRPAPAAAPAPSPAPQAAKPAVATEKTRAWMISQLQTDQDPDRRAAVTEYAVKAGILLDTESVEEWPLEYVPISGVQLRLLKDCIAAFEAGEEAMKPYPANERPLPPKVAKKSPSKPAGTGTAGADSPPAPAEIPPTVSVPRDAQTDPNAPDAPWRSFPVPFGKHAGVSLSDLDKNILFGFWANYEVKTEWIDAKGQTHQATPLKVRKDQDFRDALDAAGQHYEFTRPEADQEE